MIGLGITTYNRFNRFKECFNSINQFIDKLDHLVIVDDCSVKDRELYDNFFASITNPKITIIRNNVNLGVGKSKNKILKFLLFKGCEYLFTIEDDINIINGDVFNKYVEASQHTGIQHFNFGLHGTLNIGHGRKQLINGYEIIVYPDCVGAFTLYTKSLIEKVGLYDTYYVNALEHIDYTYKIAKEGLTTPFWEFADIVDSDKYLQEQVGALKDSSICPRKDWQPNVKFALSYFILKWGFDPFIESKKRQELRNALSKNFNILPHV